MSAYGDIEQLLGMDNIPDTWFFIVTAPVDGDTVTVEISSDSISIVITMTATEAGDLDKAATLIVNTLNADSSFNTDWKAKKVKNNPIVHIASKLYAEAGERLNVWDFKTTTTGTITTNDTFDTIKRRGKATSLSRDPSDPRVGVLGISGEVIAVPGEIGSLLLAHVLNSESDDLRVDGSVTPVEFVVTSDLVEDIFIRELRFYGAASGIKFGQFLSSNQALTNGIDVNIRSDNEELTLANIKETGDFKHKFSFGGGQGFQLDVQAGEDDFLSSFVFESPFPIRKAGTFTTDDFLKVIINDQLDNISSIKELKMIAFGFKREV